jgi:tetratricopeptide (TPR) repeat protein
MKPILLIPLLLLVSASAGYFGSRLCGSSCAVPAAGAADPGAIDRLGSAVTDVQSRQESLARSLEELRAEVARAPRGEARVPVGEIEAAVGRALAERSSAAPASADASPETAKAAPDKVRAAFDDLRAGKLSETERNAIWNAASEGGYLDELVAMFEKAAAENPGVADAQLAAGRAYLQKVFKAGGGPEAGVWATKADHAFDAALAIDDHHWASRFAKAVSLSFWPPVLGKQNEAIHQFETLIEQQSHVASEPRYAQTWLLLGNMYQQIGKGDLALSTWQKGLALFPEDEGLLGQIASAQSH